MHADSLWTIRGSLPLPATAAAGVIAYVRATLAKREPTHVEQAPHRIAWRQEWRNFIAHRDWELLGGIDSGEIRIDAMRLHYRLHLRHALLLCLVASIFFGLFIGSDSGPAEGLKWGLIALAGLAGSNYIFTIVQVRRFLRQAIDAAASAAASGVA